jgi:hypothetical protein
MHGSVEGVLGDWHSYSDLSPGVVRWDVRSVWKHACID